MTKFFLSVLLSVSFLGTFQVYADVHFSKLERPSHLSEEDWQSYQNLNSILVEDLQVIEKRNNDSWECLRSSSPQTHSKGLKRAWISDGCDYLLSSASHIRDLCLFLNSPGWAMEKKNYFLTAELAEKSILKFLEQGSSYFSFTQRKNYKEEIKFLSKVNFHFQREEQIRAKKASIESCKKIIRRDEKILAQLESDIIR